MKALAMSDVEDEPTFEAAESGASNTFPMQCSSLRKGGFVVIKGRPCKVVDMSTSKTGKHGHAKVHLIALDIFNGKKLEELCPSTHNMNVPVVKRTDLQLVDISDDDFMTLMAEDGETRSDLKVPEDDIGKEIREKFASDESLLVTILSAMEEEAAIAVKAMPK